MAAVDRICAAARAENRATGQRLTAIGELDVLRAREHAAEEHWIIDTTESVAAEVAAALTISEGLADSYLHYARALRDRLPKVGELLMAGTITYWLFRTVVYRTDLIEDPDVLAAVDTSVATTVARWSPLTQSRLAGYLDKIVYRADRDAVRHRRGIQASREFSIYDITDGITEVSGRLISTDAHALDARLDALAATVCPADPRTRKERRADAIGALAAGADRLTCRCQTPDCPAAGKPAPSPVLIHVITDQTSLTTGTASGPGALIGADLLIPPELLAELAHGARLRPLIHPGDTPPEPGYTPSQALADFVRCRDLTCRFPGCDVPATDCDIDHVIPHADGGPTHASNLSCKCRTHHLVKTFLRWRDQQLPDGTLIWTSPSGHTYVTTPGSALLFPALCTPTGPLTRPKKTCNPDTRSPNRTAMMPTRRHTRAEGHARYVAAERRINRNNRLAHQTRSPEIWSLPSDPPPDDHDPPPF